MSEQNEDLHFFKAHLFQHRKNVKMNATTDFLTGRADCY